MSRALIIFEAQRELLQGLREEAASHPIDMPAVAKLILTPQGKRQHMNQMNRQSLEIPVGYLVTFSIERGHPCGVCRHMSMSSSNGLPSPHAVWLIAEELGFLGGLSACTLWEEDLQRGPQQRAIAINVVQPLTVQIEGSC
jgi:hypothetical protein